jgi:hypothetical protein
MFISMNVGPFTSSRVNIHASIHLTLHAHRHEPELILNMINLLLFVNCPITQVPGLNTRRSPS